MTSNRGFPVAIDAALLERRVLYSAVPFDIEGQEFSNAEFGSHADLPSSTHLDRMPLDASSSAPSLELVLIDSSVDDYEMLIEDISDRVDSDRDLEVVMLDFARDGVEQISEILAGRSGLAAMHLVSHGSSGQIQLGNTGLSINSLDDYLDEIASWNDAIRDGGDLLIYGCDLAANEEGRTLVDALAELCNCDVAASNNDTGLALLGGDWELEYETDDLETEVAFSLELQQNWAHVLNVSVDATSTATTTNQDTLTVSHTTSGSNRLMLVSITTDPHGESVTSVTYNDVNLTRVGVEEDTSLHSRAEIWSLLAPDTGTADVVVNLTGTSHRGVSVGVMTFTEVNQTTPLYGFSSAVGSSTAASTTVSSAADDLVFGVVHSHFGNSAAPGGGQTEHWDEKVEQTNSSGTTEAGSASVITSWTVDDEDWTVAAVAIRADTNSNTPETLWLTTASDVTSSGVKGLDSWTSGEALSFGDPDLALGAGPSDGTLSSQFNLDDFVVANNARIDGLHFVSQDIQLGGSDFQLNAGDILFSTAADEQISDSGLSFDKMDVVLFRPSAPGDYTAGTFSILVDNLGLGGINQLQSFTLVEKTTVLGDITLEAGQFLYAHTIAFGANDVYWFQTIEVGETTTAGSKIKILEGGDIGLSVLSSFLLGMELIETQTTIGGATLPTGTLLLQSTGEHANVGDTITVGTTSRDIFALDVTETIAGGGNSTANASMVLRGSDIGLDTSDEIVSALAIGPPTKINNAPTLTAFASPVETTNEDTEVEISFAALAAAGDENDTDGTVDAFVVKAVSTGSLKIGTTAAIATDWAQNTNDVIDGSVNLYWTPDLDSIDSQIAFEVIAVDNDGAVSSGNVIARVNVVPVNDSSPIADPESLSVAEGGTATATSLDDGASLLDGDTDLDLPNDTLTVNTTPVTDVLNGTVTLFANGNFTYVHDGSETTTDSFTYEVSDAVGNTDNATVTITVTPDNDNNPVAEDESFSVGEGGSASVADLDDGASLLDGDTDLDLPNDTLTVNTTPVIDVLNGALTLFANGNFTYVHDGSETTTDSFTYEVSDAVGNTDNATVTITVTPDNDNIPVADDESFSVDFASTATEADLDVGTSLLDGDFDLDLPNDTLTINTIPVDQPDFGLLTLNNNGTFTYTHDGSLNFADSFTYEVLDAANNASTATVAITILSGNSPIADAESFTVTEGATATELNLDIGGSLLDGDTDPDLPADALTIDSTATVDASFGLLVLNPDGSFQYTHDGSENFADSFEYRVRDAAGNTDTATVTITVTPVNDNSPIADNETITVLEGSSATQADLVDGVSLLDGDTDADLPHDSLTVNTVPITAPLHGLLTLNNDGTFSYTHDGSENFTDTFEYEVIDAVGHTATATVAITVTPVNEPPTDIAPNNVHLADGTDTTGGLALTQLSATDPDDGETFTYSIQPGADGTLFSIGGVNGDELFLDDGVLVEATKNTYVMNLRVTDSAGNAFDETFSVNITSVNSAPTDISPDSLNIDENIDTTGGISIGTLQAHDPDVIESFTYAVRPGLDADLFSIGGVNNDELIFDDGVLDFESVGTYSVDVRVTDSALNTFEKTISLSVNDVNESPTPVDDRYTLVADSVIVIAPGVLANDIDPEGDTIEASVLVRPADGTLSMNADGSFSYTANTGFVGTDRFVYQLNDGVSPPQQATVELVVQAIALPATMPLRVSSPAKSDTELVENNSSDGTPTVVPAGIPMQEGPAQPVRSRGSSSATPNEPLSSVVNAISPEAAIEPSAPSLVEAVIRQSSSSRDSTTKASTERLASSFQPLPDLPSAFIQGLDELRDDVDGEMMLSQAIVGSSLAVTSSLSVGYVIWLIRGGVLLSSVLSSLPAWQLVDPLPVLGFADNDEDAEQDDDSLEALVSDSNSVKGEPS